MNTKKLLYQIVISYFFFCIFEISDPPVKRSVHENERSDPGIKSEGEEDSQTGSVVPKSKGGLGKTPNHLTLR